MLGSYGIGFALALGLSLGLTLVVRTLARRFGLVAKPRADRWHRKPTALFGGVGIFAAFALAVLARGAAPGASDLLLVGCSASLFLLGLIDDFVQLKPYSKLIGQIAIATAYTHFGLRLRWLPSEVLDQVLTIFWLVGITNAMNLLDNLDGLAGGVATITAAYLVYFCDAAGNTSAALLAAIFAGAVSGFLVFNFNPASIFMGDCGSLFLGFFLGGISLVNNQPGLRRNVLAVLTIPVLLLLIPILDTTLVTVSRRLHGRPVSQGGRDHTSHRLVALGLSERAAALTIYALAAASGGVAVMVTQLSWAVAVLLVPVFGLGLLFFLIFIGRVQVYQGITSENEGGGRALLPTLTDFGYKRRVFEVLNDLALIVLSYYAAFLLRFDGQLVAPYYQRFLSSIPTVIVVQLSAFLALGLYRGLWRYTSMADLAIHVRAVAGAWVATLLVLLMLYRFEGFARGVLIMQGVLLFLGVAASRISFRLLRAWMMRFRAEADGRRILIYGAGDGGELLVRELQNNRELGLVPIGFVDDDPHKTGRMIHGVEVLGSIERLSEIARVQRIEEILISTTKLDAERASTLMASCASIGVTCRKMRLVFE